MSIQRPTCSQTYFDARGRMSKREDFAASTATACSGATDSSTVWTFDRKAHGFGQLNSATSTLNGQTLETRSPVYDGFGRLQSTTTTTNAGAGTYTSSVTYDLYDRVDTTTFSGSVSGTTLAATSERHNYRLTGYPTTVQNYTGNVAGAEYTNIQAVDPRGNVTSSYFAGNPLLNTTRAYDPATGYLLSISTAPSTLQQLTYTYDTFGNVMSRKDESAGAGTFTETFTYDGLQRLTSAVGIDPAQRNPVSQVTYQYDGFGNVVAMAGPFTYNGSNSLCNASQETERLPGPSAVTGVGPNQYCYDPHGNMVRMMDPTNPPGTQKRWLSYYNFDLPSAVFMHNSYSNHATVYRYGADRQRLQRVDYGTASISGSATTQTTYIGNAEVIQHFDTGSVEVKKYLDGVVLQITGSTITPQYLFKDALGSTHRVTNSAGVTVGGGKQAWTPFGRRADLATGGPLQGVDQPGTFHFDTSSTHHGYTGHDQNDEVGLVHMNGRMYDATLGRFLQPDPFVQAPTDAQSYNRYSYVLNNPLNHTDPTGYLSDNQIGQLIWYAASVAIIVASSGSAAAYMNAGHAGYAALAAGAGGFGVGAMQSLSLRGALIGAFEAEANLGIGMYFNEAGGVWKGTAAAGYEREGQIFAHAALGGVVARMKGGNFGSGFISAGIGEAMAPGLSRLPPAAGVVAEAVVGGTTSTLTGGKFSNGAVSAAFAFAFNELSKTTIQKNYREEPPMFSNPKEDLVDFTKRVGTAELA